MGSIVWANRSSSAIGIFRPLAAASAVLVGLAEFDACRLARSEGGSCALRDQPALLLGQCRVQVQHEGIGIGAELGDMNGTRCTAGNEGDVSGEAIELCHDDRGHLAWRARARAAISCGRPSSASAPFPVSTSVNSRTIAIPGFGEAGTGSALRPDAEARPTQRVQNANHHLQCAHNGQKAKSAKEQKEIKGISS